MYVASREPRPEWLEACRRVAPPAEHVSHLTVRWVPGTPEAPIQRWAVFECVPRQYVAHLPVMAVLDPASADPMHRWAYEYLQQTGCLPVGLWAVQGSGGGHPFKWSREEQVLANAGLLEPATLPLLGDLPYAEIDDRVWQAIQQRSHIRRAIADAYTARVVARKMAEQKARAAEMTQTEAQLADVIADGQRAFMEHAKVVDESETRDVGALVTSEDIARYIETGDLTVSRAGNTWH